MTPTSFFLFSIYLILLLQTLPSNAIKFSLQSYRYPPSKCVWNSVDDNTLVIVTANVGPGEKQRVDIEIVDASDHKNVYLSKRDINGETRLAITTHSEGEVGVCFRNYQDPDVPYSENTKLSRVIDLDVDIGADAVDYNAIANQESLSGLETEMRKLEGLTKEIVDQLGHLKKREERFADTNPLCLGSTFIFNIVEARPSSYAVWAADSAIKRGQGNGLDSSGKASVSYEHGELQWGLRLLFEKTGNQSYYDYIQKGAENIVFPNGTVHGNYKLTDFSLDPVRTGPTFLYLLDKTGQAKYKTAADTFRSQLNGHPRTAQGQFWHKLRYPNQGWLDGIYMGDVFYAQYTKTFQPTNATAWADITNQFNLMFQNTLQNATAPNSTGLLYHGYDFSHQAPWASTDRGHSPEVWDRALGWFMMALVDVLDIIAPAPGTTLPTPQKNLQTTLLQILQTLTPRVAATADKTSGVWWLVMSQPGRDKNYFESSGASMFVYSLLKAVRRGYVQDKDGSIVALMKKSFEYMASHWVVTNSDGTMGWTNTVEVGSLSGAGDYNYYVGVSTVLNDLKGLAAFLLASIEYEQV
ncbi:hypothetical protein ONZ45_g16044 [Pleurotus djamor]|nr:hypothetical protein ONZ45_g16044 [Pleurotus djamor]